MMGSLARYLKFVVSPTGNGYVNVLLLLMPTGPSVAVAVAVSPWGWLGLLGTLVALLGYARLRLQHEVDHRDRVDFSCAGRVEPTFGPIQVWQRVFQENFAVWITVQNDGRTSDFEARLPRVSGVPEDWGAPYSVDHPAWEQSPGAVMRISHGGRRRLRLANVSLSPRALWFYTAQFGSEQAGNQFLIDEILGPDEPVQVSFELEVVNTGDRDQVCRYRGMIAVPRETPPSTQPELTLSRR